MSIAVLNTDSGLTGKTLLDAEDTQTITGAKSFNRSPNPPFVVQAGSAVVPNLIAESLLGGTVSATTGAFSSTLAVTGVATFTAAPVFTAGTASQTVELTAGKALTTAAITGTGNYVKSASPTLTGTIAAASETLSGTLQVTGVATALAGLRPGSGSVALVKSAEVTALSASDVDLAVGTSTIFFFATDSTTGGYVYGVYLNTTSITIIGQAGTVWTTGAPAAGEIQLKDGGAKITIRAGATRNNDTVRVVYFTI